MITFIQTNELAREAVGTGFQRAGWKCYQPVKVATFLGLIFSIYHSADGLESLQSTEWQISWLQCSAFFLMHDTQANAKFIYLLAA